MKLECKVCKVLEITKHNNADTLVVVGVMGYKCITKLNADGSYPYNIGDYVIYIPESALLPEWLLKEMNFWNYEENKGMLVGTNHNRIKAIRLRGQYSEGLLYPVIKSNGKLYINRKHISDNEVSSELFVISEGEDVSEYLGIRKWVPPIPIELAGCFGSGIQKYVVKYDIESIQKYPTVFQDGEQVEFTEKIHGTLSRYIFSGKTNVVEDTFGDNKDIFITSKGAGDKGFYIKNIEENNNNVYVRAFNENDLKSKVKRSKWYNSDTPLTLFGETYGVQDLMYGLERGQVKFVLFDVFIGTPQEGRFLSVEECIDFANDTGIDRVPSLYMGEYSKKVVDEYTSGNTVISNVKQIREGIVIRPVSERSYNELGRVILKSVSETYKLRKEGTEFV